MCQYRYYYYAACQHQETILISFCDNAIPTATSKRQISPATNSHAQTKERDRREREVVGGDWPEPSHSSSYSSHFTTPSASSSNGSLPNSFTSFPDSAPYPPSLRYQQLRRNSETSVHKMASLTQSGRTSLRQLPPKPTQVADPITTVINHDEWKAMVCVS